MNKSRNSIYAFLVLSMLAAMACKSKKTATDQPEPVAATENDEQSNFCQVTTLIVSDIKTMEKIRGEATSNMAINFNAVPEATYQMARETTIGNVLGWTYNAYFNESHNSRGQEIADWLNDCLQWEAPRKGDHKSEETWTFVQGNNRVILKQEKESGALQILIYANTF